MQWHVVLWAMTLFEAWATMPAAPRCIQQECRDDHNEHAMMEALGNDFDEGDSSLLLLQVASSPSRAGKASSIHPPEQAAAADEALSNTSSAPSRLLATFESIPVLLQQAAETRTKNSWLPVITFVGLAFGLGLMLLFGLKRLDHGKQKTWHQPDGERRSLPEEYANLFEPKLFNKKVSSPDGSARNLPHRMGASFTPGLMSVVSINSAMTLPGGSKQQEAASERTDEWKVIQCS
eukprot:TRINITY_DN91441_c0_g1_i1.p1 TRINITY_DN91441_c0_g1~~TRINITY_DN91441_c0_g1_i1.p1  ORF type:complete len:235 (+),score=54.78 TRINITY_DN91441_c0_g1_i1:126-830(+)